LSDTVAMLSLDYSYRVHPRRAKPHSGGPRRYLPLRGWGDQENKGQVPLGFLVLKAGVKRSVKEVEHEAIELVRERIGPVASFKAALVVAGLPKTRSGKILRGTMRRIADGEDYQMPATIDDPAVLGEVSEVLMRAGYGKYSPST